MSDTSGRPAQQPGAVRVVLVDDHALVRQGFRRILDDEAGISVVAEGGSGAEAVELVRTQKPDVIVLDMSMPDMNGLHAARMILRERPQTRVLILSMYSDEQYVRSALDAGVHGYILKSALETDLTRAVRAVAQGQQYLSPELSSVVIRALQGKSEAEDPWERLTEREKQVLQLIAHGKSNKEIAVVLGLSVNTVAVHRANLMSTLKVHKAAELVLYAVKKGLVVPD
jgi:DNA-binding NarL/FixJ family response regulator